MNHACHAASETPACNGAASNLFAGEALPVSFTAAAARVQKLIREEANTDLKLRIFVSGGGCSGFQYGFAFEESVGEDDAVVGQTGFDLLIDGMSYSYLLGAEIDFTDDLEGARFIINNPNATATCGCGSSFSV
jgi:iron-sulfur cluster insertion protein